MQNFTNENAYFPNMLQENKGVQETSDTTNVNVQEDKKRKRRKQVKKACTNCRQAHARCDDMRPCSRCVKHGIGQFCHDAKTKKRGRKAQSEESMIIETIHPHFLIRF